MIVSLTRDPIILSAVVSYSVVKIKRKCSDADRGCRRMKSYIKLFGPSIDKGIEALEDLIKDMRKRLHLGERVPYIVPVIDPSIDLQTGEYLSYQQLGEFDFFFEWFDPPNKEHVRDLIRRIDEALLYTGCRYTITTKE